VQASAVVVPADVDPQSFDNRPLGCFVRIDLR
jgi:hypothetical protein